MDETLDATDKSPIAVVLYNGNDIVQSKNVKNGDNFMLRMSQTAVIPYRQ